MRRLSGFADALANEVRGQGVSVTSIHPGGVDTPLQVDAGTPSDVRRRFLRPEDVVRTVEGVVDAGEGVLVKRVEVFSTEFWH